MRPSASCARIATSSGDSQSNARGPVVEPAEPEWVHEEVALAIHRRLAAEHGGEDGVRDPGLLASALARPRNRYAYAAGRCDFAELAAAYAFGISTDHPFVDGNKRTAFVVCRTFLLLNDRDLGATREEKYLTFLRLAAGEVSEDQLAAWIRECLVRA